MAKSSRPQTPNTKNSDRKKSLPGELDLELNQVNVAIQRQKRPQSKKNVKTVARSKSKSKKSSKSRSPSKELDLIDEGILMLQIGRGGRNEFIKPGHKKYNQKDTSYTNEVLKRLNKIQNPRGPKRADRPKTAAKR
jgi:hypothetical protein